MAMTSASWLDEFPARLAELDGAHLRRRRREVVPESGARLVVDGQSMLAFCSNDYLGLATHPALVQAACEGAQAYGVGAGASPLVSGHSAANAALERELAAFVGLPRALYFYAGYATNIGIVPALVGAGDAIFVGRAQPRLPDRRRAAVARANPPLRACRPRRAGKRTRAQRPRRASW